MRQYWAKHEGKRRWGVRVTVETDPEIHRSEGGAIFIWADHADIDDGTLTFRDEEGGLKAALAPGAWLAVFEAKTDDDHAPGLETR